MDSAGQSPQQNIEEDFHAEFMNDADIFDRRRQPLNKNTAEPFSIPFLGFFLQRHTLPWYILRNPFVFALSPIYFDLRQLSKTSWAFIKGIVLKKI